MRGARSARTYSRTPVHGVECPFCSHKAGYALYEVTSAEAAAHFVSASRDRARNTRLQAIVERHWRGPSCQLVECGGCAGVFASPFVGGDSEFYQAAYDEQKVGFYPADRWEYGESLRLSRTPFETSSCLEIGAGDGAFVKRLIGAGVPPGAITVLEYSRYGKAAMRRRYPAADVRDGDELRDLPDGAFSHAFLFQVLEHLGDLNSFVSQLRRVLKPGGLVFMSVPNPRWIEFNERNGLLLDMPPNHISRFTDGAVKSLSSRSGFSLEELADEGSSWKRAVRQFLAYRYRRLAQIPHSIPARIEASLSGALRKIAANLFALTVLPEALIKLGTCRTIGGTRLMVLQKRDSISDAGC